MKGLNSLNLGSAESFFTSSSSIELLMSSQFLLHLAMFGKKICFKLQTKLLRLRTKPRRNPDEMTVLTLIVDF